MTGSKIPGSGSQQRLGPRGRAASEPELNVRSKSEHYVDSRKDGGVFYAKVKASPQNVGTRPSDFKADLAPKDVKDKYTWLWRARFQRHDDRIIDTIKMLQDRNVLTTEEKDWIVNLGKTDRESYNRLGELLSVPRFWRPSQHGIFWFSRRKLVRMQTLKAAVHEALRTAENDNTGTPDEQKTKKRQAIERALRQATRVRYALNQTVAGRKLRIYKLVTPQTLARPEILYAKNNRKVAYTYLDELLYQGDGYDVSRKIHNKEFVCKAARALVDNKLLDARGGMRLLSALRKNSKVVNDLMALTYGIHQLPERQKTLSLLLLSLARSTTENAYALGEWLRKEVNSSLQGPDSIAELESTELGDMKVDDGNGAYRKAYEWLPHLPNDQDGTKIKTAEDKKQEKQIRKTWIAWATKQYGGDGTHLNHGAGFIDNRLAKNDEEIRDQELKNEITLEEETTNRKKNKANESTVQKTGDDVKLQNTVKNEIKEDVDQENTNDSDDNRFNADDDDNMVLVENPFDRKPDKDNPLIEPRDDAKNKNNENNNTQKNDDQINKGVNLNENADNKNRADLRRQQQIGGVGGDGNDSGSNMDTSEDDNSALNLTRPRDNVKPDEPIPEQLANENANNKTKVVPQPQKQMGGVENEDSDSGVTMDTSEDDNAILSLNRGNENVKANESATTPPNTVNTKSDEIKQDAKLDEASEDKNKINQLSPEQTPNLDDAGYDASLDLFGGMRGPNFDEIDDDSPAKDEATDNINRNADPLPEPSVNAVTAAMADIIEDAIKRAVAFSEVRSVVRNAVTNIVRDEIKDDVNDDTVPVDQSPVQPTNNLEMKNDNLKIVIENIIKREAASNDDEPEETGDTFNEENDTSNVEQIPDDYKVAAEQALVQGTDNSNNLGDDSDNVDDEMEETIQKIVDDEMEKIFKGVIPDVFNDDIQNNINPAPILIVDPQNHSNTDMASSADGDSDYERRRATVDRMALRDNDSGSNAPAPDFFEAQLPTGTRRNTSDSGDNSNNNNNSEVGAVNNPGGANQPSAPVADDGSTSEDEDL